jgi:hypothetical protein
MHSRAATAERQCLGWGEVTADIYSLSEFITSAAAVDREGGAIDRGGGQLRLRSSPSMR